MLGRNHHYPEYLPLTVCPSYLKEKENLKENLNVS